MIDHPGIAWLRAHAEQAQQQPDPVRSFCARMATAGRSAEPAELRHPDGSSHTVIQVPIEPADSTQGWAVVDPLLGHVFTGPDGRAAHLWELQAFPDWVAAERSLPGRWNWFTAGPHAVNFQIGDRCNARCVMCWQSLRRDHEQKDKWWKEMRAQVVVDVMERYGDSIDSIELVSFGEPMLNPEFDVMLRAIRRTSDAREKPIRLNLITNGSLLHKHMDLLSLPGDLTISIDAAHGELYEKIRVGLEWGRILVNLRTALAGPRHPERAVGINFTVFEDNVLELLPMGALCATEGVEYLSLLYGDGLDTTMAKGRQIRRDDPRLLSGIEAIRRRFPELRLNDYATGRTLPPLPSATLPGRGFCPLPWRQMDVGPDGEVHPCCRSYGTPLGQVGGETWRGVPLEELRRQILADDVDPVRFKECAGCPNLGAGLRKGSLPMVQ